MRTVIAAILAMTASAAMANAGEHLTTANKAIALAQADIVNAFIKHKAAAK
jgi:hypothetical protein